MSQEAEQVECPICHGDGCYDVVEEDGCDTWPCRTCNGTGLTRLTMDIDELAKLFDQHAGTLDEENREEHYDSERGLWEAQAIAFLEWLRKRERGG